MDLYSVTSKDKECPCGGKLIRETNLLFENYVQMYSTCLQCKGSWTFEAYLQKEALSFYQD